MPKLPSSRLPEHPAVERVRELESELYDVRTVVLRLTGPKAERMLTAPYKLQSRSEAYAWFREATEKVLELAVPLSNDAFPEFYRQFKRAVCPLCGDSAATYGTPDDGFAFPEGLMRHLRGERGARQCDVMKVALELAIYHTTRSSQARPGARVRLPG